MKLAVMVDVLDQFSHSKQIIENINRYADLYNVSLFIEEPSSLCAHCNCPIFYYKDAWNYNGIVVAQNTRSAASLLTMPRVYKKYLYCWDQEWENNNVNNMLKLADKLELIVMNKESQDKILNNLHQKTQLLPQFDLKEIISWTTTP